MKVIIWFLQKLKISLLLQFPVWCLFIISTPGLAMPPAKSLNVVISSDVHLRSQPGSYDHVFEIAKYALI